MLQFICDWFSWSPCDIPNWLALLIEGIFGLVIALTIYRIQQNRKNKRESIARRETITSFVNLEIIFKEFDTEIRKDFTKQDSANKKLEELKSYARYLQMILLLYSQDLDSKIVRNIQYVCESFINWDLKYDKSYEFYPSYYQGMSDSKKRLLKECVKLLRQTNSDGFDLIEKETNLMYDTRKGILNKLNLLSPKLEKSRSMLNTIRNEFEKLTLDIANIESGINENKEPKFLADLKEKLIQNIKERNELAESMTILEKEVNELKEQSAKITNIDKKDL